MWLKAFEKQTNQQDFKELDTMASIQWVVGNTPMYY